MSNEKVSPARAMAALFEGLGRREQMALLGKLEIAGGSIYRALAIDEKNAKAREALLKAAEDEERNGKLLIGMTTAKTQCEKCCRDVELSEATLAPFNAPSATNARTE